MQTKLEKTIASIIAKFEAVQWCSIEITMKNSGHKLVLAPIAEDGLITCDKDIIYVRVYDSPIDIDAYSIKELAQNLIDYDQKIIDHETMKAQLFDFYTKNINIPNPAVSDLTIYSDDHKSLFGFRPGKEFGQPRA